MKQLTDEFLEQVRCVLMQHHSDPGHREARIELLKTINNLTGEAQPADGRCDHHACIYPACDCEAQPAADDKAGGEVVSISRTDAEFAADVLIGAVTSGAHCQAAAYRIRKALEQTAPEQPAADDKDSNAPWLSEAHMLCTDAGIQQGNITDRIKALREKQSDDKAGGEVVAEIRESAPINMNGDTVKAAFLLDASLPAGTLLYARPQPQALKDGK